MRFSNSKGYMVHRDRFDRRLVDRAVEAGAKLLTGTRVLRRDPDGSVQARRSSDGNSEIRVSAKVVIGADGPCSCVGSWVNARNINLLPGVQYTMPLKTGEDCTEVYFSPEIFGGYGWFFPKGDRVNIGIGMRRSDGADVSVRKLLDDFVDRFVRTGRVENRVLTTAGGWIPAESLRRAVYGDVILAGDAAGHTHPITGAGIFAAVMCGKMAGRHAAHSVCEENPELLECYDEDWQGLFGKTLSRAFFKRVQMETGWDDLENTVRKTWVAFREYYAD
jgi:flavin-dependent dehydrogenase